MKGVVFNLLEEVVRRQHGEDVWDEMLDRANASGAYTSLGNYDDAEIVRLVAAASEMLGKPASEVLRWFGREAMKELFQKYPAFFEPYDTSRAFVLAVNSIIHPEVRKLYSGASCPHFRFDDLDDGGLSMVYRSARKLCHLAEGFVEGAADHYGEVVDFRHVKCQHHGDPFCQFEIRWAEQGRRLCTAA
jgi:hypothetical protein